MAKNIAGDRDSLIKNDENLRFYDVTAKVKQFSLVKGYGFMESTNMSLPDIFVHLAEIQAYGLDSIDKGDTVVCDVINTKVGYKASVIKSISLSSDTKRSKDIRICDCKFKWFNPVKGFGFVTDTITGEDILIDKSLVSRMGARMLPGDKIVVAVYNTRSGGQALRIIPMENN